MSKMEATGPPEERVRELFPLPMGRTDATVPHRNTPRQRMSSIQTVRILFVFILSILPPFWFHPIPLVFTPNSQKYTIIEFCTMILI
jgi:hypothetical protein